jgi:superfamily I DNA/RNA helicase
VTCIEDSLRTSGRTSQLDDVTEAVRRVKAWTDEAYSAGMRCSPAAWCRWFAGRQAADEATEAPIWLSTVHGVKGLEADHVAIVGLRQGGFDHRTAEDARLFFVAASRARESVMLTYSTENVWKPSEVRAASEFWEMGGEL